MLTIRICVSVSLEEKQFLDQYNLSPSALLKTKITELKCNFDQFASKELKRANEKLKTHLEIEQKLRDFVEEKKLMDEFLNINFS